MRGNVSVTPHWLATPDQAEAATGMRNGAPSRLMAFIADIASVRSTRSLGSKAAETAA